MQCWTAHCITWPDCAGIVISQIRYAGGKKKKVKAKLLVNIIVCSYNIINWLFVTKRVLKNLLIKQWQTIRKMKDKTSDSDLEFSGETVSL